MRLGSSTDKKDSGRLHVDFAQARDDFYEWECRQRMRAREERHRRKLEEDRLRPPSPPAIMHYSEHEAALLAEKLKGRRPARGPFLLRRCPPKGSGRRPQARAPRAFLSCAFFACRPPGEQVAWRRDTPGFFVQRLGLGQSPGLSLRPRHRSLGMGAYWEGHLQRPPSRRLLSVTRLPSVTRAPRRPHLGQVLTRREALGGQKKRVEEGLCLRRWS